jgi:hypothetical protein
VSFANVSHVRYRGLTIRTLPVDREQAQVDDLDAPLMPSISGYPVAAFASRQSVEHRART